MAEVYVCRGKDCRKHAGTRKICDLLDAEGVAWTAVRCQKVCKAPVVGVKQTGPVTWFRKVRDKDARKRLLKVLQQERPKALKSFRAKGRTGKLR